MKTINKHAIKKITPFHIWIISLLLIPVIFYFFIVTPDTAKKATTGALNASYIENHFPVALNGEWEYYDNQFLFPSDFSYNRKSTSVPEYRNLPGQLSSTYGYGTYRLTFSFLGTSDLYSLRLTSIPGAARIYIDGNLLSDIGFTSSLKESSETIKDNQYVVFPLDIMRQTHEIIIQVSNFSNYHSGMSSPIYFGTQIEGYRLSSQFKFAESVGLMSVGVLAILLIFLLIFKIQMKGTFYLLIFTLSFSFHLIYSSTDLLTQPVHSSTYFIMTKIHVFLYCIMGLCMILSAMQIDHKTEKSQYIRKIYLYCVPVLFLAIFFSSDRFFFYAKTFTIIYLIITFLHTMLLLLRRILHNSHSALMLHLSFIFFISYFILLYFNSQGMVSAISYNGSYTFLLIAYVTSQLAYVALQVSKIYTGNTRLAHRMVATNKLKSEFISATSHELRTPLHGIINIIESTGTKLDNPNIAKEQLQLGLKNESRPE